MSEHPMPEYLTVQEVATELRVADETVRRWIKQPEPDNLIAERAGSRYRVLRENLTKFLTRQSPLLQSQQH